MTSTPMTERMECMETHDKRRTHKQWNPHAPPGKLAGKPPHMTRMVPGFWRQDHVSPGMRKVDTNTRMKFWTPAVLILRHQIRSAITTRTDTRGQDFPKNEIHKCQRQGSDRSLQGKSYVKMVKVLEGCGFVPINTSLVGIVHWYWFGDGMRGEAA
jgi:hypothetical protein